MTFDVNDYNNRYKLPSSACQVNPTGGETSGVSAKPEESAAVVKGHEKSTSDELKLEKKEATEADKNSRSLAAARNAKAKEKVNNTAYGTKLAGTIEDKGLREDVLLMTEAINNRDEAKAAVYYEKLQKAGVFTEGVEKPPYAEALEKRIQEQKNQELAKGVVDKMNTDEGINKIKDTYDSFGATRKEIRKNLSDEYGIQHGRRQIAKAIDKNRQHLSKQLALKKVIIDDGTDTSKSYEFTAKDGKTLKFEGSAKDAYKYVKEHSSEIYGKEWDKKAPPVAYMSEKGYDTAVKLNELAEKEGKGFIDNGEIDIEQAQAYAREKVSMAGDRGDQNELKALAGELNVKPKDVKAMLRGINIDYQKDRRWVGHVVGGVLGAGVAATDLATGFMGSSVGKTVETTIAGGKILETVVQPGVIKKETIKTGPDGKTQTFTEYYTTPGSTTLTTTDPSDPTSTTTPGSRKPGVGDVIKDLALGYTIYDLTSKGLNKVLMHDPQILKKGHTLADALDNPDNNYLKKKSNNEVMKLISEAKLDGYTPEETRAIKLQLLEKCMGDSGDKLNRRELFGVLATLKSIPPKAAPTPPPATTTPSTPTSTPTTTTTERTVLDIGGDGFFNPDAGEFLKDADGNKLGKIGDGDGAVGLKGSIGHARDWEKLKQRGAQFEGNNVNAKAQYVIANEKGETAVIPDDNFSGAAAYEAPLVITLKDNTNGKVNTYRYRKLSSEEAKPYVPANAEGPFYILDSASDNKRELKAKNIEVYRLDLKPEEEVVEETDEKGNITKTTVRRYKYNLEQYKGYRGSRQTSMFWNHRAK